MHITAISNCIPEKKDIDRVLNFVKSGKRKNDDEIPFVSKARPMAQAITDRNKLVRRAKAVVAVWGTADHTGKVNGKTITVNVWEPFLHRLSDLGFTPVQVHEITKYDHKDKSQILGVSSLFDWGTDNDW